MKTLLTLLLIFVPLISNAAPIEGITTGVIMSEDSKPFMATGFVTDFSTKSVGGAIFNFAEISILKSDRSWDKASELYVNRDMLMKAINFGSSFYVAVGGGTWIMINTDGPDLARMAGKVAIGGQFLGLHAYVSGEYVHMSKADWYFASASIVIVGL